MYLSSDCQPWMGVVFSPAVLIPPSPNNLITSPIFPEATFIRDAIQDKARLNFEQGKVWLTLWQNLLTQNILISEYTGLKMCPKRLSSCMRWQKVYAMADTLEYSVFFTMFGSILRAPNGIPLAFENWPLLNLFCRKINWNVMKRRWMGAPGCPWLWLQGSMGGDKCSTAPTSSLPPSPLHCTLDY